MTVFPCQWTIVSLLKSHRYLPFSTMCPSLKAHGGIKWTGPKTMQRTRGFDATWLCYLKWAPKHHDQLYQQSEGIHQLHHTQAHFAGAARGESWATPGLCCTIGHAQLLSWSQEWRPHLEGNDYSFLAVWVLAGMRGTPRSSHSSCLPGGHGAFNGTTCGTKERGFLFKWESCVVQVQMIEETQMSTGWKEKPFETGLISSDSQRPLSGYKIKATTLLESVKVFLNFMQGVSESLDGG